MLEELIRHLVSSEITTLQDLAGHLSASTELLEQMLLDLERGGYIETIPLQCEKHCAGCAEESACALVHGQRIWRVTDKGYRLAGRPVAPA